MTTIPTLTDLVTVEKVRGLAYHVRIVDLAGKGGKLLGTVYVSDGCWFACRPCSRPVLEPLPGTGKPHLQDRWTTRNLAVSALIRWHLYNAPEAVVG